MTVYAEIGHLVKISPPDFYGFRSGCAGCTFLPNLRRIARTRAELFPFLSAAICGVYFEKRRFLAEHLRFRILGPLHVAIITRSGQRARKTAAF